MAAINLASTRDLARFRPFNSAPISSIASSFLAQLTAPSASGTALRSSFLAALLGSDARPREVAAMEQADERIRQLFLSPPTIVVTQGAISPGMVAKAWDRGDGLRDMVFICHAIHQEIVEAKDSGDRVHEANLGVMILATLAYEFAQWIHVKVHGLNGVGVASDTLSIHTTDTSQSYGSMSSYRKVQDRRDVGDKAVLYLFGHDYELVTYTFGEREMIKRRYPSRRTPTLTPPIIYAIFGDTPSMTDATHCGPTVPREVPGWKDPDDSVMTVLTPAGAAEFHGLCLLPDPQPAKEYQVSLDGGREKF
ncbi:hypothetical protein MNV49_001121 [Pseudohyphozyma bogoriensis]|nr:hypothetical protein MNV49_001121 [Pseudohyphozyma bogoriensis]